MPKHPTSTPAAARPTRMMHIIIITIQSVVGPLLASPWSLIDHRRALPKRCQHQAMLVDIMIMMIGARGRDGADKSNEESAQQKIMRPTSSEKRR